MKSKIVVYLLFFSLTWFYSCSKKNEVETIPQKKLTSPYLTPEVLWSFGRINNLEVSPDGTKILFGVRYYNIEKNSSQNDFYVFYQV